MVGFGWCPGIGPVTCIFPCVTGNCFTIGTDLAAVGRTVLTAKPCDERPGLGVKRTSWGLSYAPTPKTWCKMTQDYAIPSIPVWSPTCLLSDFLHDSTQKLADVHWADGRYPTWWSSSSQSPPRIIGAGFWARAPAHWQHWACGVVYLSGQKLMHLGEDTAPLDTIGSYATPDFTRVFVVFCCSPRLQLQRLMQRSAFDLGLVVAWLLWLASMIPTCLSYMGDVRTSVALNCLFVLKSCKCKLHSKSYWLGQ